MKVASTTTQNATSFFGLSSVAAAAGPLVDTSRAEQPCTQPQSTSRYDYFIVLDFEATCERGGQSTGSQEVIELPSVLVDGRTGEQVAEFQQ